MTAPAEQAQRSPEKRFADLAARLALKGFELRRMESGALLICRWNLSRELSGIETAGDFARQVGA